MKPDATDNPQHDLGEVIGALFPDGAAACFSALCPPHAELLPEELPPTRTMAASRLLEFRHGRHAARQAMSKLGFPGLPVRKQADRSPQWPDGLTGSIAHTGELAAAVVARSAEFLSLGLDIEQAGTLEPDAAQLIVRPDEDGGPDGRHARQLFSIKESIYKCLHPVLHTYIDFQEMQVKFSAAPGAFTAIPHSNNFDAATVARLQGRYSLCGGLIVSACWIMPTG